MSLESQLSALADRQYEERVSNIFAAFERQFVQVVGHEIYNDVATLREELKPLIDEGRSTHREQFIEGFIARNAVTVTQNFTVGDVATAEQIRKANGRAA